MSAEGSDKTVDTLADYQRPSSSNAAVISGLPPRAYTSDEFFAQECAQVLAPNWLFAGFAHQLPNPGDMVPVSAAARPLALIRGRDGAIRAFHNLCRHRGHLLIDKPCNASRSIVCPYHAWAYDLDGALLRTPNFAGPGQSGESLIDHAAHGLVPVRCQVWQDWVFVNLDGQAEPLAEAFSPVMQRLGGVDLEHMTPVATLDFGELAVNWKFLIENFVEPYHVPVVHNRTAAGQPLKGHTMIHEQHCFGCAVDASVSTRKRGEGESYLDMDSLYLVGFPNFVLGHYAPDQLGVHLNLPLAAERTSQVRVIYFIGEPPEQHAIDELAALWRKVHGEDHQVIRAMQAGRHSPAAADGGLLSPHWESSIAHFHELIAAQMQSGTQP